MLARLGWAALNISMAALVVVVMMLYGPFLEGKLFPVVRDFTVETVQRDGDRIWVSGSMDKVRACNFSSIASYAVQGTGEWVPLQVHFPEDTRVGTRAAIEQAWGPWWFTLPNPQAGAVVMFVVAHNCPALYQTHSVLAVFEVPL